MKLLERLERSYERHGGRRLTRKVVDRATVETLRFAPSVYWSVAPRYYRASRTFDTDSYAVPVDPYAAVSIDPNDVTRFSAREYPPWRDRRHLFGAVRAGSWDRRPPAADAEHDYHAELYLADRFEESVVHRSIERHFENGVPWRETRFVRRLLEWLDRSERVWHGCETESDVLERCREIDDLYDSIRRDGCVRQRELVKDRRPTTGFLETLGNEILVDVARDGEPLFVSGRHRLSIAKILGLSEIPVVVLVRHRGWMDAREARYGAEPDYAAPERG